MKKTLSQKGKKQRKQDSSAEEDDDEEEDEDDEDDEEDTPKRQTRRRGATNVKRCHTDTFINMLTCPSWCFKNNNARNSDSRTDKGRTS